MKIKKENNLLIICDNDKELTIEKNDNYKISFSLFKNEINSNQDKSFVFEKNMYDEDSMIAYDNFKLFYEELKKEYKLYQNYFDMVYNEFIDEFGNKKSIPIYSDKHKSFIFYSENGNFKNNSYIRIFEREGKYYIYFNKPSMEFMIKEDRSKYNYSSFYKYFYEFYDNVKNKKRNKKYEKLKNFNNFV